MFCSPLRSTMSASRLSLQILREGRFLRTVILTVGLHMLSNCPLHLPSQRRAGIPLILKVWNPASVASSWRRLLPVSASVCFGGQRRVFRRPVTRSRSLIKCLCCNDRFAPGPGNRTRQLDSLKLVCRGPSKAGGTSQVEPEARRPRLLQGRSSRLSRPPVVQGPCWLLQAWFIPECSLS